MRPASTDESVPTAAFGWMHDGAGLCACLLARILFPLFLAIFTSVFDYTLIDARLRHLRRPRELRHALRIRASSATASWVTRYSSSPWCCIEFLIGFIVALMLNAVERFKGVYYLILLLPLLINPVVVALIWRMFLHPELGIVNYLLGLVRSPR